MKVLLSSLYLLILTISVFHIGYNLFGLFIYKVLLITSIAIELSSVITPVAIAQSFLAHCTLIENLPINHYNNYMYHAITLTQVLCHIFPAKQEDQLFDSIRWSSKFHQWIRQYQEPLFAPWHRQAFHMLNMLNSLLGRRRSSCTNKSVLKLEWFGLASMITGIQKPNSALESLLWFEHPTTEFVFMCIYYSQWIL